MHHGCQNVQKSIRYELYFAERQSAVIKLPVFHLIADDVGNQPCQRGSGRLVQSPSGRLNGIRQHNDGGLAGLRFRPGIAESLLESRGRLVSSTAIG